jgi:hypothetical protein
MLVGAAGLLTTQLHRELAELAEAGLAEDTLVILQALLELLILVEAVAARLFLL